MFVTTETNATVSKQKVKPP